MKTNQLIPHHRKHRLPEFDYSQPGTYFVTIVTQDRKTLFGQIVDGEMVLNNIGKMVEEVWIAIPDHFPNVELGGFVFMPNHFHGIVTITEGATHGTKSGAPISNLVEATHASPLPRVSKGPIPGSIGAITGSIKSATTKAFHEFPGHSEDRLWQQGFYDRVIRNEREFEAIYDYILANPMNWDEDEEFFSE
ncbi:MAG: transposase [Anaerolineaceae bacterium]|nr:transposase [Anaerolineaceae bacterium]